MFIRDTGQNLNLLVQMEEHLQPAIFLPDDRSKANCYTTKRAQSPYRMSRAKKSSGTGLDEDKVQTINDFLSATTMTMYDPPSWSPFKDASRLDLPRSPPHKKVRIEDV